MKNIIYLLSIIMLAGLGLGACNDDFMERYPETSIGKENFFNTAEDLDMFIYSLYDFPNHQIYNADGYQTSDNAANTGVTELKNMMTGDPSPSTITGGWNWGQLRDINYFLENFDKADLPEEELNHYEGLGRFFRAKFYMEKVKRYSDVPWYDQVISPDDEDALMKARDPRETVTENLFADYAFAAEHVKADQPAGAVDKWTVLAYMARHALYEGTYRKYHSELELESTAGEYLKMARDAAKEIMDQGGFAIYNTGNPESDYGSLFNNTDLTGNPEIILGNYSENNLKNSGWWHYLFGNYEVCPSKDLLQAYLMDDGSYYTEQPGYETNLFVEEFEDRDPRLSQTYAYPGWELVNTSTYSQGAGTYVQQLNTNFSGYHQIKGFINDTDQDVQNDVDYPVVRYAEVLLTYAEARAELGELEQNDLDITVNVLRDRAGIPPLNMGVTAGPMQQNKFPNIQSDELLEIRRERRIELALEGFRHDDMMRWEAGPQLEKEPEGIYFPGLGKYDLTGDGVNDIILIDRSESVPASGEKETNANGEPLIYYRAGPLGSDADVYLENGNSGTLETVNDRGTFVNPKYYYRPIPQEDIQLNPNLDQIFGW